MTGPVSSSPVPDLVISSEVEKSNHFSLSLHSFSCGCVGIGRQPRLRIWWRKPWGFESPHPYTRNSPALTAGFSRTGMGGLRLFTVTPPLNPLPRGGDSAAEAAVRLTAQSLRSEVPSIQCLRSARAVVSLRSARTGPSLGPLQAFSAVFACTGPRFGPVQAPSFWICGEMWVSSH